MIPFMAESIYQNLVRNVDKNAPESVHLCRFPEVCEEKIDKNLEDSMDKVLEIVVLGRAARNGANRKNRQPLSTMYIKLDGKLDEVFLDIIKDELNIKKVSFTDNVDGFVSYIFKPQLKTVGPKYGKQLGEIRTALSSLDGNAAKAELDKNGKLTLDLPSGKVELGTDDLLIESAQKEGFYALTDKGITVAIDTVLTDDLVTEGYIREIVSKVQMMRKDAGFNVMDHINITVQGDKGVTDIAVKNKSGIVGDTLADSLVAAQPKGFVKEWDINGEKLVIGIEKV